MADTKISALTAATALTDASLFATVQSGVTKKITGDLILDAAELRTANTFGEGYSQPSSFTNGFIQGHGGVDPLKIWTTGFNNKAIYWRGMLDCSLVTFTDGYFTQAFRLPVSYRPVISLYFPIITPVLGVTPQAIGCCLVNPDGFVLLKDTLNSLSDVGFVDFSNVSYYIDPF